MSQPIALKGRLLGNLAGGGIPNVEVYCGNCGFLSHFLLYVVMPEKMKRALDKIEAKRIGSDS